MTLPKEVEERVMSVAELEPTRIPAKEPDPGQGRASGSGWRMPGGEDLLNFALSAGLAAGVWWLENRGDEPAEAEAPAAAGGPSRREPA